MPFLKAQPKALKDHLGEKIIEAVYNLGPGGTLENCSLQNGHYLPANSDHGIAGSTYEIISSQLRKVRGSMAEEAVCTARAVRAYEESGP